MGSPGKPNQTLALVESKSSGDVASAGNRDEPVVAVIGDHQLVVAGAGELVRLIQHGKCRRAESSAADAKLAGQQTDVLGDCIDRPDDVIARIADGDGAIVKQGNTLQGHVGVGDRCNNGI